jgi:hypothetical protein
VKHDTTLTRASLSGDIWDSRFKPDTLKHATLHAGISEPYPNSDLAFSSCITTRARGSLKAVRFEIGSRFDANLRVIRFGIGKPYHIATMIDTIYISFSCQHTLHKGYSIMKTFLLIATLFTVSFTQIAVVPDSIPTTNRINLIAESLNDLGHFHSVTGSIGLLGSIATGIITICNATKYSEWAGVHTGLMIGTALTIAYFSWEIKVGKKLKSIEKAINPTAKQVDKEGYGELFDPKEVRR